MKRIPELIISALIIGVIVYVFQFSVSRDRLAVEGQEIFLELAPVDPLSLLQGQYMRVQFAVEREQLPLPDEVNIEDKCAVLKIDERRIATFVGVEKNNELGPDEVLFRGHLRKTNDWERRSQQRTDPDKDFSGHYVKFEIPQRTFLFKENTEDRYESAKYGVFRVGEGGDYMLMDLADENLQKLTIIKE
jgi:uncharacterized membrane-anchored protein